jgi:hypothetical protein
MSLATDLARKARGREAALAVDFLARICVSRTRWRSFWLPRRSLRTDATEAVGNHLNRLAVGADQAAWRVRDRNHERGLERGPITWNYVIGRDAAQILKNWSMSSSKSRVRLFGTCSRRYPAARARRSGEPFRYDRSHRLRTTPAIDVCRVTKEPVSTVGDA